MDKVAVFRIAESNSRVQIQPVPINKFSHVPRFFFVFIHGVLQGDTFLCDTFTYFNYFSIWDFLRVQPLFLSDKKDKGISCYLHEYLAKVRSIPSPQMHDLLEILEHAFIYTGQQKKGYKI